MFLILKFSFNVWKYKSASLSAFTRSFSKGYIAWLLSKKLESDQANANLKGLYFNNHKKIQKWSPELIWSIVREIALN